jgi:hypothetical protein
VVRCHICCGIGSTLARWCTKARSYPAARPPIVSRALFDAVQTRLAQQHNNRVRTRAKTGAILTGLIFDDAGNRMSPSHARKNGVRYRCYTSLALFRRALGRPDRSTGCQLQTSKVRSRMPSAPNSSFRQKSAQLT